MDPILQIKNLKTHFIYADKVIKAVDGISFQLNAGEIYGIVGESGSGKTMTALSIMQLLPGKNASIIEGEIIYKNDKAHIDLLNLDNEIMNGIRGKKIALIFQEAMGNFNPIIRCFDQLKEAVSLHNPKLSRNEIINKSTALLSDVQLKATEHIRKAYPHELSGGQLQRIMFAMALAGKPDILIADEPTTALDVIIQQSLLLLLKQLREKYSLSVLFISHDLNVIAEIADNVCVMKNGKIVESGDIKTLFNNPSHSYTKELLNCRPGLFKKLHRLPVQGYKIKKTDDDHFIAKSFLNTTNESYPKSSNNLLKVRQVYKTYRTSHIWPGKRKTSTVLRNISFDISKGEILGIVGQSGSGKSTLAKILAGLLQPDKGQIMFDGNPIFNQERTVQKKFRQKIQIIFQNPFSSLTPHLTVGHQIMEVFALKEQHSKSGRKSKAIDMLLKVGLDEKHFYRYPRALSGGQRQRICIARALASEPQLLICDEPVSSLDVSVQARVLNLLKDLQEEKGLSILFISHDLSVVYFMCDRINVLKEGAIIEKGSVENIIKRPQHPYTKVLLQSVPGSQMK